MRTPSLDLGMMLGATFVAHLTDAARYPLLVLGKDRWSFAEVADLGIIQPKACRILSRIAADLDVTSATDLYRKTSPYYLAGVAGCGVTTLYVLLRVFVSKDLSVEAWYAKGQAEAVRRFQTLKRREQLAERRTRRGRRRPTKKESAA